MDFKKQLLGFVNCMQAYTCLGAIRIGKPELDLMPERDTFYEICSRFKPGQLKVFVARMEAGCKEVNDYFTSVKKMFEDRKYERNLCLLNAAISKAKYDKMDIDTSSFCACMEFCYRIYANVTGKTVSEIDPQKNITIEDCNEISMIRGDDIEKWNDYVKIPLAEMMRAQRASVEFEKVEEWYDPPEHPRNLGWIIYMSTRANDPSVLDDMFITDEDYKPEQDLSGEYEGVWNLYKSRYSSLTRSFFFYLKVIDEYLDYLKKGVQTTLPDKEGKNEPVENK